MKAIYVTVVMIWGLIYIATSEAKAEVPPPHQLNIWINASCASNNDPVSKENCALLSEARNLIAKGDNAGAEELIAQARNNTLGRPTADTEVPMTASQQREKAMGNPQWRRYQ